MKILIVEDEHRIATTLKKGLELEHYTVDLAFDGQEGFDLASSEDYDLLILDLMLPKKDGLSLCADLRKEGNHVPILILTAKSQTEDKILGLDTGADDYLAKPFSFDELLARVKALLRRPHQVVSHIIKYSDLTLNANTYQVERQGYHISLTNKEYLLLKYLVSHPEQILTKDHLITHVWDYSSNILPNTVEAFIKKLRQKVDKPFKDSPPLIRTVRGFGYKLSLK